MCQWYVSVYLPLLLFDDNIYRYLTFVWGNVVEIECRRGVDPSQAGELGLLSSGDIRHASPEFP